MPILIQIILSVYFVSFFLFAQKDLRLGVYAVIFLLGTYLVRFSVLGIPTTALELMIYSLVAAYLWRERGRLSVREDIANFFREDKLFAWGIVLLLAGVVSSTFFSSDIRTSLGILKGWFVDPLLLLAVYLKVIETRAQAQNSLLVLMASAAAVSLIALVYLLGGELTFDGRLRAFYESPNYLAMYVAPGLIVAVYAFVLQKLSSYQRFDIPDILRSGAVRITLLAILSGVLYLTKSYGAILGVFTAVSLFLIRGAVRGRIAFDGRRKRMLVVSALGVLAVFSILSVQKYSQIIDSNERSSLHSRLMIWNASVLMLEDSPVFGIGPGTFQETYLAYQERFPVPYLEWAVAEPHNTLLAFYLQAGLLGLAGFLLVLVSLLRKARTDDVFFLFLAYFLIHGLVDTLYWKNDLSVIFFLFAGAAIVCGRSIDKNGKIV